MPLQSFTSAVRLIKNQQPREGRYFRGYTMEKRNEAYKLCDHINKNVCMGFSATPRPDSSVLLTYTGYEQTFDMSLEISHDYKVWMMDFCQYSVSGRLPTMVSAKNQIGFITLALASYNVALNKRLSK